MSLLVTPGRTRKDPGYFRIGDVLLSVPPEGIGTNFLPDNQEITPLRSRYPMYKKTGHGRWVVSVTFKLLGDYTSPTGLAEFKKLQRILAMFCAAPFVEVENEHLRQILISKDPSRLPSDRMAFALQQLRVDTIADVIDGLQVTLRLYWFNYRPYTTTFAYLGDSSQQGVNANQSAVFSQYLDRWIQTNIENPPMAQSYPGLLNWSQQTPGTTSFHWRFYRAVSQNGPTPPEMLFEKTSTTPQFLADTNLTGKLSVADAIAKVEGYRAKAGNLPTRDNNPGDIVWGSFAQKYPNFGNDGRFAHFQDPATGFRALNDLLNSPSYRGLTLRQIVYKYAPPTENNSAGYVEQVSKWTGIPADAVPPPASLFSAQGTIPKASALPVRTTTPHTPPFPKPTVVAPNDTEAAQQEVIALAEQGWLVDYTTSDTAFLYRPYQIAMDDEEHGGLAARPASRLSTTQISIVFTNNLATIPLEGQQYPTYQHIGAPAAQIFISLSSDGDISTSEEPEHPGLTQMTGMVTVLEDQFHRLKSTWRSVRSVHSMQAVVLQNQILNMLGIFSVIPRGLNTETVDGAPTLVQGQFLCSQYENVFEQLEPYLVKSTAEYEALWQSDVFGESPLFQTSVQNNPLLAPLQQMVADKKNRLLAPLYQYLLKVPEAQRIPLNITLTPGETQILRTLGLPQLPDAVRARVAGDSAINFNDFVLLSGQTTGSPTLLSTQTKILQRITSAVSAGSPDPLDLLYRQLLNYEVTSSRTFSSAVQQMEVTPDFQQRLAQAVPASPGATEANLQHGAYKDLGLLDLNDRPAHYFRDYAAEFKAEMDRYLGSTVQVAQSTMTSFNQQYGDTGANTADANFDGTKQAMEQILQRTVIPSGTMDRAFPTFKLFLVEDDNLSTFYMFDDFYSYASVLDVEVIRYQDQADQAVIKLTNLANLLDHKLYDGSVEGKFEYGKDPTKATPTSDQGALTGPAATKDQINRTLGGFDLRAGFDNSGKRMPLQYFALQTGTKIQIRLGFSNNPDELVPVFHGTVTYLNQEQGDVLEIVAQGFSIELTSPAPEDLDYNGFNVAWLTQVPSRLVAAGNQLANSGSVLTNLQQAGGMLIHSLDRGPAMGGFAIMGESGDAVSVMAKMLTTSRAIHFGHWQVNVPVDQPVKGYGWSQIVGKALWQLGATKYSTLLLNSCDRSAENILINHAFTPSGDALQKSMSRDFQVEQIASGLPSAYYIPKDPSITPWRIIQDVKRRYPEFVVRVKPYGFPFGVDGTLVFASPNDFYTSRLPLVNESEIGTLKPEDNPYFQIWWKANRALFLDLANRVMDLTYLDRVFEGQTGARFAAQIDNAGSAAAPTFTKVMDQLTQKIDSYEEGLHLGTLGLDTIFTGLDGSERAKTLNLQKEMVRLRASAQNAMQVLANAAQGLSTAPRPGDRIKPVRKYIFVTSHNIIHNGIVLNQNFYNSVRVDDHTFACNEGVKVTANHMRILDVDALVIDPLHNVRELSMHNRYGMSFLKEELGKMYRGELVLTSIPEAEPGDVILLYDISTGMVGPVEIDSVIQAFNQESGAITIVKPRALVAVNEAMTLGMAYALGRSLKQWFSGFGQLTTTFMTGTSVGDAAALAAGGLAFSCLAAKSNNLNPLFMIPLQRFGQPWVAGIDGWKMEDYLNSLGDRWTVFQTYEIQPYLKLVREAYDDLTKTNPY